MSLHMINTSESQIPLGFSKVQVYYMSVAQLHTQNFENSRVDGQQNHIAEALLFWVFSRL